MTAWQTTPRAAATTAVAALCACLPAGLAACSSGGGTLTAPCAVIVDASPSGGAFHADQRLKDVLPGFLVNDGCRTVTFVPLTYASQSSTCSEPTVDISGSDLGGDIDPSSVEAGRRKYAEKQANALLACARKEEQGQPGGGGSDVLGALARAVTQRPAGSGTYHILVISDLVQHTANADLYHDNLASAASRTRVITGLIRKGLVPDMAGMALEVTDRGRDLANNSNGDLKSADFNAFWNQLFASKAAGDPQVSYD